MTYAEPHPDHYADARMQMLTVFRDLICRSRAVGKPDPSDDELYFAAISHHIHAVDVHRHFASVKAEALAMEAGGIKPGDPWAAYRINALVAEREAAGADTAEMAGLIALRDEIEQWDADRADLLKMEGRI